MRSISLPMLPAPRFPGALATSLLLHAGLALGAVGLGWDPHALPALEPPEVIPVMLDLTAPVLPAVPREAVRSSVRKLAPAKTDRARTVTSRAPAPSPKASVREAVTPNATATLAVAVPGSALTPDAGPSDAAAQDADLPAAGTTESGREGAVADMAAVRSGYLATLRERLEAHKHYPPLLRRRGIAGTVLVAFRVDRSGQPCEIHASESSPNPHLLAAALQTVMAAAPFVPLPPELGPELRIEVPIAFVLQDE